MCTISHLLQVRVQLVQEHRHGRDKAGKKYGLPKSADNLLKYNSNVQQQVGFRLKD